MSYTNDQIVSMAMSILQKRRWAKIKKTFTDKEIHDTMNSVRQGKTPKKKVPKTVDKKKETLPKTK